MTSGTAFTIPANPGIYPAGLALNAGAGMRAREEALHKELIAQYKILKGVKQALEVLSFLPVCKIAPELHIFLSKKS
jgi:hypothetical protein